MLTGGRRWPDEAGAHVTLGLTRKSEIVSAGRVGYEDWQL